MKLRISTFILGIFMMSFSFNSSSKAYAQEISTYEAGALAIATATLIYKIDSDCKDGDNQARCKNGECGQVACISFRKKCDSKSDCGGDEQPQ